MKIVVTGATGHLGRYVAHALGAAGHEVVALSRSGATPEPPFGSRAAPGLRSASVDLTREASVSALAEHLGRGVALVHLAAWHPPSTASTTADDRARLLEVNVMGTMRALDAARRGVAAVVYASSFEVYGAPGAGAIDESARTAPLSDYGATKLAGEHHLSAFSQEEGVRCVALRMPAVYGPGETTPRALPLFLRAAARGEPPTIFGDGADLRDQLHARDAAAAVALSIGSPASGVFNIADGEPHSIHELARLAIRVAGLAAPPASQPRQKPRLDYHMSIARARRELGFAPSVELEDGMREELVWLRSQIA